MCALSHFLNELIRRHDSRLSREHFRRQNPVDFLVSIMAAIGDDHAMEIQVGRLPQSREDDAACGNPEEYEVSDAFGSQYHL